MSRLFRHITATAVGAIVAIGVALQVGGLPSAWADDEGRGQSGRDEDRGQSGPNNGFPVYLDHAVHPTAQDTCTPGFLWQGAGNPSTTFQRKRNLDAGVELAIKGIIRQGPDIRSTYVDNDGLVHIEVPSGPQPTNPARAAWNFTYSYDVALNPGNPMLDSWDAELWIDLDPSEKTKYLKLELVKLSPPSMAGPCPREPDLNGYGWQSRGTTIIPDDEGTDRVTQNSQNLAFYSSQIDGNPNMSGIQPYTFGPGQFDVVMSIKRKRGGEDSKTVLHVVFDVVSAPTQTP
jgi:hypothetical protein